MSSFLDLPREIRDHIYTLVFPASTDLVEIRRPPRPPPPRKSSRKPPPPPIPTPLFKLRIDPLGEHRKPTAHASAPNYTSSSLLRVNRQIYLETRALFWENTTFFFPGTADVPATYLCSYTGSENLGVLKTMNMMGQTASRLITSIRLDMTQFPSDYKALRRILHALGSRARHGQFRRLELWWQCDRCIHLTPPSSLHGPYSSTRRYLGLLESLRKASNPGAGDYDRIIYLDSGRRGQDKANTLLKEFAMDMHFAFGGRLLVDGIPIWDNYKMVHEVPLLPD